MKKVILTLCFCLFTANVFAIDAKEILEKSFTTSVCSYLNLESYEMQYEFFTMDNDKVEIKEVVSGSKKRLNGKAVDSKKGIATYVSIIDTETESYVSAKAVDTDGNVFFIDYKALKEKESSKTAAPSKLFPSEKERQLDSFNVVFSSNSGKNNDDYLIVVSVKDAANVRKAFKENSENAEIDDTDIEEFFLSLLSIFDMKYYVAKHEYLLNRSEIKISEDYIYEKISESEKYQDKSEAEKKQLAKETVDEMDAFGIHTYSNYKPIEGASKYYYPSLTHLEIPTQKIEGKPVQFDIKINYIKSLKSDDLPEDLFTPTNVKKGKGKIPKVFTHQHDIIKVLWREYKKEIWKNIQNSAKEQAKEEGKKVLKDGAKSVIRGFAGF